MMKRILCLLLVLTLGLPVLALAEEGEVEIEELQEEDYEVDAEGNLVLSDDENLFSTEELADLDSLLAAYERDESVSTDPQELELNTNLPDNVVNILLLGVDSRGTKDVQLLSEQLRRDENEPRNKSVAKRADVQMILSVNTETGAIKLSSIARNTYVEVPTRKNKTLIANSFGHAIYKDGKYDSWVDTPELAVRTVNHNFEMNIRHYVAINFYGVEEIIEKLGGADVDLTKKEAKAINTYLSMSTIKNSKGDQISHGRAIANTYDNHSEGREKLATNLKDGTVQHLDGLQALMYARLRSIDSDFVRTARTRHLLDCLLKSVFEKIKSGEMDFVINGEININALLNTVVDFTQYMITNMDMSSMFSVITSVLGSDLVRHPESATSMISEFRIPMDGTWKYSTVDGSSVTVMSDKQQNVQPLHEFIYGQYIPAN